MAVIPAPDGLGLDVCCNECMGKLYSISQEEYLLKTQFYDYTLCDDCKKKKHRF